MAINYWGITPEINAIRLTTGPGAAAMTSVIAGYQAAGVTHLEQGAQMMATAATTATGSWWGQGGTAMMAAAAPKSEWQIEAGAHAEKATGLIGAAAAAHTGAVAATIPYPVCVANRVREATLQATNFLGFNTPAILQTDAEYGEYHAQNATAMTGYFTAALDLIAGLSTPLRPPVVTGANPAGLAGSLASMGAQGAQTGVQAATQGLSAPLEAAGQAASAAAPAALSAATSASSGQSSGEGDVGTTGAPQLAQPGGSDLLGSSQSMMGMASSLPSMAQGMTQPLSQLAQAPLQMGGQLSGLMGSMGGMGGGPFGGLSANAPGANLASSLSGVSGGFGSGGGPVTAALTKPAGLGLGSGPIGTPSAWWGPAAVDGSGAAGQNKPTAGARATMPGGAGTPMGSGMGMMPMGAAQAGQRRDQGASRGQDDTSLSVVLDDADAIPILTANGVVYTDGGG